MGIQKTMCSRGPLIHEMNWLTHQRALLLAFTFLLAGDALAESGAGPDTDHYQEGSQGMVVSVSGPASEVGLSVLKRGGDAVDAAVATAFALAVAYPLAGNIGGGGFMLVHPGLDRGKPVVFDYRETAPAAAWQTMYTREESQFTHRAVATPGTLRGLQLAHARFGRLSWRTLVEPAISMAREGFLVDKALAKTMNETLADSRQFSEFQRVFGKPAGGDWKAGDLLVQPDLAQTLQQIADVGPDAFYTGAIARKILAEMTRGKGLITAQDLANYRAFERRPLSTRYRGTYDVYVPPPPCSGGVCLLEELNQLETFDLKKWGSWSPKAVHVMAEAMRRANRDRARYLGDPDFTPLPQKLISPDYGHELARSINLKKATPSRDLATDIPPVQEGPSTTHFSIIDQDGMAVANTYTLERRWGSRIVVKGAGFLLNNDMRAFNLFPGVTDTNGAIGTEPNIIAPGKRPLSSMTPTIVARNGRVVLITGSSGSRAIPHTILEIMVNTLDFGLPIKTAVDLPRFSQEWFPDHISCEHGERYPEAIKGLKALGHSIVPPGPLPFQGDAHTIYIPRPHTYQGVADQRINGRVAGY
jgi:gamma-glutamyltranspeptidase/glutathione hydrolase